MNPYRFNESDRAAVYRAIAERRDMRHFRPDPIDPETLHRLLDAAHLAPSVGFMQPWRFIRITDHALRGHIHALVHAERERTAAALADRGEAFRKLKVEGILECGELLVVALMDGRESHVFGRRTLPEMDIASAACAIQNLWLAARAEGVGVGWVSLFEPAALAKLLGIPAGGHPIAILCLGHVQDFYPRPLLETSAWAQRRPLQDLIYENRWPDPRAFDADPAEDSA